MREVNVRWEYGLPQSNLRDARKEIIGDRHTEGGRSSSRRVISPSITQRARCRLQRRFCSAPCRWCYPELALRVIDNQWEHVRETTPIRYSLTALSADGPRGWRRTADLSGPWLAGRCGRRRGHRTRRSEGSLARVIRQVVAHAELVVVMACADLPDYGDVLACRC